MNTVNLQDLYQVVEVKKNVKRVWLNFLQTETGASFQALLQMADTHAQQQEILAAIISNPTTLPTSRDEALQQLDELKSTNYYELLQSFVQRTFAYNIPLKGQLQGSQWVGKFQHSDPDCQDFKRISITRHAKNGMIFHPILGVPVPVSSTGQVSEIVWQIPARLKGFFVNHNGHLPYGVEVE